MPARFALIEAVRRVADVLGGPDRALQVGPPPHDLALGILCSEVRTMADRRPGRFVHRVDANVGTEISLVRAGITFKVVRKWRKGKDRRIGTLEVNAAGLRWRRARNWYPTRMTWDDVRAYFEG
jgi:hypothetical protein